MSKPTTKPKVQRWSKIIRFNWTKDRLSFLVIIDKQVYYGWALEGSLNEVSERTKAGHMQMGYALVTPAEARRWAKTGKPPKGYPA